MLATGAAQRLMTHFWFSTLWCCWWLGLVSQHLSVMQYPYCLMQSVRAYPWIISWIQLCGNINAMIISTVLGCTTVQASHQSDLMRIIASEESRVAASTVAQVSNLPSRGKLETVLAWLTWSTLSWQLVWASRWSWHSNALQPKGCVGE